MTRKELDALKAHLRKQKEKAADMEILAEKLFGILDRFLYVLPVLPDEVKEIIAKYKRE